MVIKIMAVLYKFHHGRCSLCNKFSAPGSSWAHCATKFQIHLQIEQIVSMVVKSSDTIRDIKSKVFAREGLAASDQELFFEGNHLSDTSKTLADYNISQNSMINLLFGGTMQIFVKILSTGKTLKLVVNDKDTIQNVKARIEAMEGICQNRQGLIYMGKSLEDNPSLLACNIRNGSTLQMILCPVDKFDILLCTMNGNLIKLEASSWYTIRDIKLIVEGMKDIDATKQRLFCDVTELEDSLMLSECRIFDRTILHLQVDM
ncbi:polyubiquitin 11-like isoform X1 [Asparagus officinalis]|uniref:polyubiquitin 11-like isoform X1 n=2 Tax=Asparagus officinalis TaxID=4686 RepID=UPI00098E8197|nr:polyubiquitin 11-like isoform X1 [Asparagus officinalis]